MLTTIPYILFIFGSLVALGNLILFLRRRAFLRKALQTTGTVIDYRVGYGSSGTSRTTTVRFQTNDGRTGDCQIDTKIGKKEYTVGEQVTVNYSPQNPCGSALLGDWNSQPWKQFIVTMSGGAIIAFISLAWIMVR